MADCAAAETQSSLQLLVIDAAVAFDAPNETAELLDIAQQVWTAQALCVTLAATTAVLEDKLGRTALAGKFDRLSGSDDELLQGYWCVADAIQELAIDWESTGVLAVSTDLLSLQHLRKTTELSRPSCHTHWTSPAGAGVRRLISALRGERTAQSFQDGPPDATVPPVLVNAYFEFHPWGTWDEDNPRGDLAKLPPYSTEVLEGFCIFKSKVVFAKGMSSAVGRLAAAFTHRSAADVDASRASAGGDQPFPSWRYAHRAQKADDLGPTQMSSRVLQSTGTAFPGLADALVSHPAPNRGRDKTASFGLDHTFPGAGPVSEGLVEARKTVAIRSRSASIESAPSLADCEWLSPTAAKRETAADSNKSPEFGLEEPAAQTKQIAVLGGQQHTAGVEEDCEDSNSDAASEATVDCIDESRSSNPDASGRGDASEDIRTMGRTSDETMSQQHAGDPSDVRDSEAREQNRHHGEGINAKDDSPNKLGTTNLMSDAHLSMVCSADEMALLAAEGLLWQSGPSAKAPEASVHLRSTYASEKVSRQESGVGKVALGVAEPVRVAPQLRVAAAGQPKVSQVDGHSPVMKSVVPTCISPRLASSAFVRTMPVNGFGITCPDKTEWMKDEDDDFVKGGSFCDSEPFAEPPSQSPTVQTQSPRIHVDTSSGAPAVPRANANSFPVSGFCLNDRIRGTYNGAQGNVVGFDGDGHPLVRWDASGIVTGCHPDMVVPHRLRKLESPRRVPIKRMTSVAVLPTWTNDSELPRCHTIDPIETPKSEREFLPRSSTVADMPPPTSREVLIRASADVRQAAPTDRRFAGGQHLGVLAEQPESPRSRTPARQHAFAATMGAAMPEHSFSVPAFSAEFSGQRGVATGSFPRSVNSLDPRAPFAPGSRCEPSGRHAMEGQPPAIVDVLGPTVLQSGPQRSPVGHGRTAGTVYRPISGPPGCPSPPALRSGWTLAPQVALQAPRPAMPFSARGHW
mmetsp:Transcript_39205/g.94242  ORF Transcript_39205/g.94242 Transcript_39205/m.94242 type:complete len:971 (+) Transcript_39205:100-3012(+)